MTPSLQQLIGRGNKAQREVRVTIEHSRRIKTDNFNDMHQQLYHWHRERAEQRKLRQPPLFSATPD